MKKTKYDENHSFRTHIKEPRWQQFISLAIVVMFFVVWLVLSIV